MIYHRNAGITGFRRFFNISIPVAKKVQPATYLLKQTIYKNKSIFAGKSVI